MKGLAFCAAILLLTCQGAGGAEKPLSARAALHDVRGDKVGEALLTETPAGVRISLEVRGLPPGVHAFHIHAADACAPPEFKSAGGHFNPYGRKHGAKNPEGMHAGDLPNLLVQPDGTARMEVTAPLVTLGPGKGSLFGPEGTSLVIHALPDDEMTDPAGNAGARIACGVVVRD